MKEYKYFVKFTVYETGKSVINGYHKKSSATAALKYANDKCCDVMKAEFYNI